MELHATPLVGSFDISDEEDVDELEETDNSWETQQQHNPQNILMKASAKSAPARPTGVSNGVQIVATNNPTKEPLPKAARWFQPSIFRMKPVSTVRSVQQVSAVKPKATIVSEAPAKSISKGQITSIGIISQPAKTSSCAPVQSKAFRMRLIKSVAKQHLKTVRNQAEGIGTTRPLKDTRKQGKESGAAWYAKPGTKSRTRTDSNDRSEGPYGNGSSKDHHAKRRPTKVFETESYDSLKGLTKAHRVAFRRDDGHPGHVTRAAGQSKGTGLTDSLNREFDWDSVVVNFANVGATFCSKVLGRDHDLFDWEGVRRCVTFLKKHKKLKVTGVIDENFIGPDNNLRFQKLPNDIRAMCETVEEAPRAIGVNHKSIDDEMTIKCAYRRNCRFLDNDNYRDWQKQLRDQQIRHWLKEYQNLLQIRYYFDQGLGTFDVLEGNFPKTLLAAKTKSEFVTTKDLRSVPRG